MEVKARFPMKRISDTGGLPSSAILSIACRGK